jgi:hypothetical protein
MFHAIKEKEYKALFLRNYFKDYPFFRKTGTMLFATERNDDELWHQRVWQRRGRRARERPLQAFTLSTDEGICGCCGNMCDVAFCTILINDEEPLLRYLL